MNTTEIIFSFIFIFIIIIIITIYYNFSSNNNNNNLHFIDSNTKLLDANNKFLEVNNKLSDANNKLSDTNNKLSDTNNKLSDANNKLSDTNNKFQNCLFNKQDSSIISTVQNIPSQNNLQYQLVSVPIQTTKPELEPINTSLKPVPINNSIKPVQINSSLKPVLINSSQSVPNNNSIKQIPINSSQAVPINNSIKQIPINTSQPVPINNSIKQVPINSSQPIPINNSIKQVRINSSQPVPINNSIKQVPINSSQPVPINSSQPVPINSSQPVPINSSQPVPINSSQPVPINSSQQVPINSSQPVPINSSQPVLVNSSQPVLVNSSQPVLVNSSQPVLVNSSQQVLVNSSQPVLDNSSQPVLDNSSQPVLVNSSQQVLVNSSQPVLDNSSQPVLDNSSQPVPVLSSSQEQSVNNQDAIVNNQDAIVNNQDAIVNNQDAIVNNQNIIVNNIILRKEPTQYTNKIELNEEFESVDKLESSNKKFKMLLKNSNIIIVNNEGVEIFNTMNTNLDGVQIKINAEGNLVILSLSSKIIWSLNKKGIDKLILENDGAIRVYDNLNNLIWESQPLLVSFWQEFNSFKLTIEGQQDKKAYSNGTYTVSSSSYVSTREPYNLFNKSRIKFWNCSSTKNKLESNYFTYPYKNGLYIGGGSQDKIYKTNDISGEWIQIELPYNMILTNYSILNNQLSKNNFIKSWMIFGSNDNQNWETITSNILQEQIPAQTIGMYEINSTKDYCIFRLVITSLESGNEIQILQLNLTGLYVKPSSNITSSSSNIITNNFLKIGDTFDNNSIIESNNKKFKLLLGQDKNLIITDSTNNQLWSSDLATPQTNKVVLLSNGNFSMVDKNNNELWSTKTTDKGAKILYLDNDGGLRLYNIINNVIWESKLRITPLKSSFTSNEIDTSDGKYTVSASSSNSSKLPFNIFNIKGRNKYWDLENGFLYKNGAYIGTTKTSTSESTDINGEWVQIKLPKQLLLTNYALLDFVNIKINFIKSWIIVGTNDNTTWDIVDKKNISVVNQNDVIGLYNTSSTKSYNTYRLIITSVDGGTTVQLVSFYLYGIWS
jgi:hypothetical protein